MANQRKKIQPSQIVNSIPILDIISKIVGVTPTRVNRDDYWYLSFIRASEKTASLKVNISKNVWWDFGVGIGGRNVDLLMCYLKTNDILDIANTVQKYFPCYFLFDQPIISRIPLRAEPDQKIEITKNQSLNHPALLHYIKSRYIDLDLAKRYCNEIWYKNNEANFFAIGFKSESGYELRTKYFKGCTGKGITFFNNKSNKCTVTEGFFNWLSLLILYPEMEYSTNHLILNTTANINKAEIILKDQGLLNLYLDNDEGGFSALKKIESMGFNYKDESEFYKGFNDLNQYLIYLKTNTNDGTKKD
jgi:hypothetical protein